MAVKMGTKLAYLSPVSSFKYLMMEKTFTLMAVECDLIKVMPKL